MKAELEIVANPDAALREPILQRMIAFNASKAGDASPEPFAILLRDPENGETIGGLWAVSVFDWLYVELLFVPEELRKTGLGSRLMTLAETEAGIRGCIGVRLDTFSFQAPGFYEKLGYHPFGKLENHPKGYDRLYYCKRL